MDKAVAEKFESDYGLIDSQLQSREVFFKDIILPCLKKRYLSHLVSTIEDLINDKQKKEFLSNLETSLTTKGVQGDVYYKAVKDSINTRRLRLFSIVLAPVPSNKVNARTNIIKGCALITYWKDLPTTQKRVLIAHELGHIVNKYLFGDSNNQQEEGLATLFGYIAMCDKDRFYKNEVAGYTHFSDMSIYDELTGLCKRAVK